MGNNNNGIFWLIGLGILGLLGLLSWQPAHKASKKRVFLSFDSDDRKKVDGLRLLAANPDFDIEFYDESLKVAVNSVNAAYIKQRIKERITRASVTVCLVGTNTHLSGWVDWELRESYSQKMPIIAMALKDVGNVYKPPFIQNITLWAWNYAYLAKLINQS